MTKKAKKDLLASPGATRRRYPVAVYKICCPYCGKHTANQKVIHELGQQQHEPIPCGPPLSAACQAARKMKGESK